MNTIIYTEDFEPITCIELPLDVIESAEVKGGIMLSLKRDDTTAYLIQVDCHKLTWIDGSTKTVFVTKDEELALVLKPSWLVGQKSTINAFQRTVQILTDKLKKLN